MNALALLFSSILAVGCCLSAYANDLKTEVPNYSTLSDEALKLAYLKMTQRACFLLFSSKVSRYCAEFGHCSEFRISGQKSKEVLVKHFKSLTEYLSANDLEISKEEFNARVDALADLYSCYFKMLKSEVDIKQDFGQVKSDIEAELRAWKTLEPEKLQSLRIQLVRAEEDLTKQRKELAEQRKKLSAVFYEKKGRAATRTKILFQHPKNIWIDPRQTEDQDIRSKLKELQ